MGFSADQIQFYLQIATTVFVPVFMYVFRQQENRMEAKHKELVELFTQKAAAFEEKFNQTIDDLKTKITDIKDTQTHHGKRINTLVDEQHKLELAMVKNYLPKDEVIAELKALEGKLERSHEALLNGITGIRDNLHSHEVKTANQEGRN